MAFYSFDTSSLLNGRRDLLPPATFPSLWANIEAMIADGRIRCVDVVRDELSKREDEARVQIPSGLRQVETGQGPDRRMRRSGP